MHSFDPFTAWCVGYPRWQLCYAGEEGQEAEGQPVQGALQWLV